MLIDNTMQPTLVLGTRVTILASGVMFLVALLLGVWKYKQMALSTDHVAHPYVDIAHRAALMYSFALLLVATFVQLSGWNEVINLIAAGVIAVYFFATVGGQSLLGWRRRTDNQFRDPLPGLHLFMISLVVGEIGGWLVLLAGFVKKQIF